MKIEMVFIIKESSYSSCYLLNNLYLKVGIVLALTFGPSLSSN